MAIWIDVGGNFTQLSSVAHTFALNAWYHAKIDVIGTVAYGKVWAFGSAEPGWQLTAVGIPPPLMSPGVGGFRVGAADVVPFVRFRDDDPEPVQAAHALGEQIGALGIPVLGYGELGGGRRPAFYRRGGTAGLQALIDAGAVEPLYGPATLHPTAGAVLLGVRGPLIAFNLSLIHI